MAEPHDFRQYGIDPSKDRNYENIAYVMALVYHLCEKRISRLLAPYEISPEQYNVLMALRFQEDGRGMTQTGIGRHLIVSPGSITRLVDKLSKRNLLTVVQNPRNRRENIVKITEEGIALTETIWPRYDAALRDLVGRVPPQKQEELAAVLADWFFKLQETKQDA